MKKSDYYFLAGLIVTAPHLWPGLATVMGACFIAIAAWYAAIEIHNHMKDIEKSQG